MSLEDRRKTTGSNHQNENWRRSENPDKDKNIRKDKIDKNSVPAIQVPSKKRVQFREPEVDLEDEDDSEPELPFRNVPPVTRAPKERLVPFTVRPAPNDDPLPDTYRKQPSYKMKAPIDEEVDTEAAVDKLLKSISNWEAGEILRHSDAARKEVIRRLTKKRVVPKASTQLLKSVLSEMIEELGCEDSDPLPFAYQEEDDELFLRKDAINVNDLPAASVLSVQIRDIGHVPAGALVMDDPVLQYLESLERGEEPKQLYVAKESQSLRAVYPLINGIKHEESVTDGGSQIVSMSEASAGELGVSWDPDVRIHMQSANNQIEMTLGLARNVPFLFGDITVYLQVHIIRKPAYKVLLGRPFDTLTESLVKNSSDGGQTITISDPNTGKRCTIPTYARGSDPAIAKKKPPDKDEGF